MSLTAGLLLVCGVLIFIYGILTGKQTSYGSDLEKYIISRYPQNNADVERLTIEFEQQIVRNRVPWKNFLNQFTKYGVRVY